MLTVDQSVLLGGDETVETTTESFIYPAFSIGHTQPFTLFDLGLQAAVEEQFETALYFEEILLAPPQKFNPAYRDYGARLTSMPKCLMVET